MDIEFHTISEGAPRTVIFCHHGAIFLPGDNLNKSWEVFRKQPITNTEETEEYYEKEIIRVKQSGMEFIFAWYDTIIADFFERLLHDPGRPEFKEWKYMAFFHPKKINEKDRPTRRRIERYRKYILASMKRFDYIIKYTIPYCHILTSGDMKEIDEFWEAPSRAKSIDEIKNRNPRFPIYTYPVGGAKALQRNKRLQELLAKKKVTVTFFGNSYC